MKIIMVQYSAGFTQVEAPVQCGGGGPCAVAHPDPA